VCVFLDSLGFLAFVVVAVGLVKTSVPGFCSSCVLVHRMLRLWAMLVVIQSLWRRHTVKEEISSGGSFSLRSLDC
jgi:hypothetical protein